MLDLSCTARDERDRYFCHLLKEIVTQKRVHAHAQDARDHTPEKMDSARAGRLTECCSDLPRGAARAAESSDSAAYVELSKSAAAFFSRTLTVRSTVPPYRRAPRCGPRGASPCLARATSDPTVRIEAFRLDEAAEDEPRPHPALRVERSVEVGVGARRLARLDRRAPPHRIRLVPRHPDGSGLSSSAGAECLMLRCAREAPCPRRARS